MKSSETLVFLSLGSNLGERRENLEQAIQLVGKLEKTEVKSKSSVYSTKAWGLSDQPDFLNQVVCIVTSFSPQNLMQSILQIEEEMGRIREVKWGPRIIDIDILFFGDEIIDEEDLKIPHPEVGNRKFILIPLQELQPDLKYPVLGKSVSELLENCQDSLLVEKI